MNEPARLYAVAAELSREDEQPALLLPHEQAYVTETATGLTFATDTPIEVWGALVTRLTRQHKRIEWALGDALQFGEHRYGDTYAQWADETNLSENTLATIKWVAGKIESSRRREDVGWSHHREVAALDPPVQDRLLSEASERGMTRFALRQAVKVEQERQAGRAVDVDGAEIEEPELPWAPTLDELTPDARRALTANAPLGRHRNAWISGALWSLVWADQRDAFIEWRGP
jgi:hypothetical protein